MFKKIFSFKIIITIFLFIFAISIDLMVYSVPQIPTRKNFDDFPKQIEEWRGMDELMGEQELKILNPTDYILRDYRNDKGMFINLYVGYFDHQTEDSRVHSPRSCLPGGGWKIMDLVDYKVDVSNFPKDKFIIKKAIVQKGVNKMLVFYWLQSRGRIMTNEYLARFYLIYDSIIRHRSDDAIVRLMTPVGETEGYEVALDRLEKFVKNIEPEIKEYLPE